MAISFPLAFPVKPITRVEFKPMNVVGSTKSVFTGQQQIVQHQGQWWEALVETPSMVRADAEDWITFFLSLEGIRGTFNFGDVFNTVPRGVATGTPVIDGAGQTGQDLITGGWSTSINGILKAGDWVQIGAGAAAKLFKNLVDVNSDGSGNATLSLWPQIRTALTDTAPLIVNSPVGLFRLQSNSDPFSVNVRGHYKFSFAMREAI